jgi:hypothetical protein
MLIETVASIAIAAIIANSALFVLNTQRVRARATAAAQACLSNAPINGKSPTESTEVPASIRDALGPCYVYDGVNLNPDECRSIVEMCHKAGIRAIGVNADSEAVVKSEDGKVIVVSSDPIRSLWVEKA